MPALARFVVLLLAGFVTAASIGKLVPHVSWLVENYDISLGLAGVLVSGVMLPGVLAGWALGLVVDRVGARRIAIMALSTHAVASLGYFSSGGFWTLLALRLLEGIGYILFVVAATVLVVAVSESRHRGLALSVWSAFAPVGFALGQWTSAAVTGADRIAAIGLWHGALLAGAALLLAVALPRRAGAGGKAAMAGATTVSVYRHPPAVRAAAAFGASVGVLLAAVALAPLVLAVSAGLTVAEAARLTALAALPGILGRFASGWLLDRGFVPRDVMGAASLLGVIGLLVALLLPVPLALALACFALFQIAIGGLPGVLSAMLPAVAPSPSQLGAVSGLTMQTVTVGNLLGPPLVLSVYAATGPGTATWLLVGVIVLSVALIGNLAVFRTAQR